MYQVSSTLVLHQTTVENQPSAPAPATHHVLVLDCSGSMSGELPRIRAQIKSRLATSVGPEDTVSLIWFSGQRECGIVLEGETVGSLKDLQRVQTVIDRWLKPVGMTSFVEPLEMAKALLGRLQKSHPGHACSLFFLSDGQDNCNGRAAVLTATAALANQVHAATVVEYGYYADRPTLTKMAEKLGGSLIFADSFSKFEPTLEGSLSKKPSVRKVRVPVGYAGGEPLDDMVFAIHGGDVLTFSVVDGVAEVPADIRDVWYLTASHLDTAPLAEFARLARPDHPALAAAYAAVAVYAVRMRPYVVLPLLRALGDVAFIESFAGLFGKQQYSAFEAKATEAALDPSARWVAGYDPTKVPRDDAFTVLDILRTMSEDDRVLLSHPAFSYSRIGRSRVDSLTRLTPEESEQLESLTKALASEKDIKKIREIQAKVTELTNKPEPLVFVEDPEGKEEGYSISSLVFNEDRPNASILIRREGTVDLSGRIPAELSGSGLGKIPGTFRTFQFRNFTIVKDGLVNVSILPVRLSLESKAVFDQAVADGRAPASAFEVQGDVTLIHLADLPVLCQRQVQTVSAADLCRKTVLLTATRAAQKVYNSVLKEKFPGKKSTGFEALYGAPASTWLAEQGITDYSGFGPKVVQAESTDVYLAKVLEVKIKGYSTLPSLNEFKKQASKGKYNGPGSLMLPAWKAVEDFLASEAYVGASDQDALFEAWLSQKAKEATSEVRGLLFDIAQLKMSIIVGQVWFQEFSSLDETKMEVTEGDLKFSCTLELKEVQERI